MFPGSHIELGRPAAERLTQLRRRTLDLWLAVALLARLVPALSYGPVAWRERNLPFLATAGFELLVYTALLVWRRRLPLRLRSWAFCLVWMAVFAVYLPRGVYAVPLVNAVAAAILATLLLGPYVGAGLILTILSLLLAAALLPPEVLAALSFGPPHPPAPDPPALVATGIFSLIAVPLGLGLVLRGLLRGLAESQVDEERFRGIIQASPEAMAVLEWPGARLLHVNPAFEQLFGWGSAEALGRTPVALGVVREQELGLLRARLGERTGVSGRELLLRRRDGSSFLGEAGLQRTEIGGEPVVLVVVREVTAQRRLEAAVRQGQRMEAMGALAGGVAHNFRNALGSILPNLDYCLGEAPPPLREPLEDARSAASAAVDLATRLTRMAHQGEAVGRERVELRRLLADVVAIARSTFGARIAVEASLDVPGTVRASRGELHQVFLNLLLNARDAVAEVDDPRIEVRLSSSADGARLVAVVADNGCGMDPATLQRVGEPFFTTKPEGRGTGLGLYSAFAAIRDTGGRLHATSRPGQGSAFTVELPADGEEARATPPPVAPRVLRPGVRVLVVDDDALLLEAVCRQLAALGLEAEPFTAPAAALERLRATPRAFDILITDLAMPGMSGRELAAQARQAAPGLPVLVLSGTEEPEPIDGVIAILAKPASTAALAEAAGRCLGIDTAPGGEDRYPLPNSRRAASRPTR